MILLRLAATLLRAVVATQIQQAPRSPSRARVRRSARSCPVFIPSRPTAAIDTPLGQQRCRDSVELTGPLRPEILLGAIDYFDERMFVGNTRCELCLL